MPLPPLLFSPVPATLAERLTPEQQQALAETPRGGRIARLAADLRIDEAAGLALLAEAAGLTVASNLETDPFARGLLPARLVHDYQAIPIRVGTDGSANSALAEDSTPTAEELARTPLHLATAWPADEAMQDWLRTFTPRPLVWHLAVPERVHQLIIENFGVGSGSLDDGDEGYLAPEAATAPVEEAVDEDAAVVRFVTDVIAQAVTDNATDIHFEPQEGQLRIRYRVDGLLVPVPVPENLLRFQDAIISRLKIMARLNISERRLPQDGRINFKAGGTTLDIRVSTIPTIYAESISLRLLNQKKEAYTMERLGMSPEEQAAITHVLDFPHGIVLVTGPTGSGKSTSLNAFLRKINSTDLRIVTIEDPIEYEVPGVNQMQVRPEIGLSFAGALRHVLRQDPDVIMVGEIRDRETADIAIRASLTGHLVFSTLHTNDAPSAVARLVDIGVQPFLVSSAVRAIVAQRLVRKLCPKCKEPAELSEADMISLGLDASQLAGANVMRGAGCSHCKNLGYKGRMGIFEIFTIDDEVRHMINNKASTVELRKRAREMGMRTLREDGIRKVLAGMTTAEEVISVSMGDAH